jgi:hypothetical protein
MKRNHLHNVQSLKQSDVQFSPHAIAGSVFRLLNDDGPRNTQLQATVVVSVRHAGENLRSMSFFQRLKGVGIPKRAQLPI